MAGNISLLGSTSRVEVPFVKVTIGDFTFGIYQRSTKSGTDQFGSYKLNRITYPNYIKSLQVQKINGTVNKYTLAISYPITDKDDPNFFEKIFSSVSDTRKIKFSYGDMAVPSFVYKEEEGIILSVKKRINIASSVINYTVKAVSTGTLSRLSNSSRFASEYTQPSRVIKRLLYENPELGLLDIFPGMRDRELVEQEGLIAGDDIAVQIEEKTNISVLDYLLYLVDLMTTNTSKTSLLRGDFYVLTVMDDTDGKFEGTYFKISKASKDAKLDTAYTIDVGYPTKDVITSIEIEDDETYSIYYNFSQNLTDSQYVQRVNDDGKIEEVYAPVLSSGTAEGVTTEDMKAWWTRVTEFPIKASITFKGLLRPAMLMSHVRLNIIFWGRKYIDSGLYIVTKQIDNIDESGFKTTLSLLRIDEVDLEDDVI